MNLYEENFGVEWKEEQKNKEKKTETEKNRKSLLSKIYCIIHYR